MSSIGLGPQILDAAHFWGGRRKGLRLAAARATRKRRRATDFFKKSGRQAVNTDGVRLAPVCGQALLALMGRPIIERRTALAIGVDRHAPATGSLHKVDVQPDHLPRADRLLSGVHGG